MPRVCPKPKVEKKKVYTPDEAMLATEESLTVEFKVQSVTKPTEIKLTPEKRFSLGRRPQPR